ncbi:MAG: hypothetical protein HYU55_09395 [Nocardioides sp.]|nr:hypothetical protein [Nocardioides sp.]
MVLPGVAVARHHGGPHTIVNAGPGAFGAGGLQSLAGDTSSAAHTAGHTPGHWIEQVVCTGGSQTCGDLDYCDDGSIQTYSYYLATSGEVYVAGSSCPVDAVAASPEVTPGLVLRALRRVPLPASELVVQPPGGRTLVNFETNFYTERGELTRVVRLLGRRVELRIWPESFTWRYGDGASERTRGAGAPYPDLEITHRYLRRGRVVVRVDTTYAADFRVGAGGWRHVDGTVTIPGEAEGLRVVTARPVLVGG